METLFSFATINWELYSRQLLAYDQTALTIYFILLTEYYGLLMVTGIYFTRLMFFDCILTLTAAQAIGTLAQKHIEGRRYQKRIIFSF